MAFLGKNSAANDARAAAYRDWLARRNPLAIASLALGIISLIEAGVLLIFGIAGIVLGIIALRQLKQRPVPVAGPQTMPLEASQSNPPRDLGHRLAITGIILCVISLVMATWLYAQRPQTSPSTQPATQAT